MMDFEEQLMALIDRAVGEGVSRDQIYSALELRLIAMDDEARDEG